MGDVGDTFRARKEHTRDLKAEHGVNCPDCTVNLPKAIPKVLLPGQRCWCGYKDARRRLTDREMHGETNV